MKTFFKSLKFRLLVALCIILFALFYGFGYIVVHTLETSYKASLEASLFTVLKDIKHDFAEDPDKVFRRLYLILNRNVYFPFFFSSFFEDLEERSSMIRSMIIFLIYTSKLKLHINANCCKISLSSPSAR